MSAAEQAATVRAALHTLTSASLGEADVAEMHEDSLNAYAALDALIARCEEAERALNQEQGVTILLRRRAEAAEADAAQLRQAAGALMESMRGVEFTDEQVAAFSEAWMAARAALSVTGNKRAVT